jgi:hypothetical protein
VLELLLLLLLLLLLRMLWRWRRPCYLVAPPADAADAAAASAASSTAVVLHRERAACPASRALAARDFPRCFGDVESCGAVV